jgi:hypothetical protein
LGLLTLSVGVLALWVRSYVRADVLVINRKIPIQSTVGSIVVSSNPIPIEQERGNFWFRSTRAAAFFDSDTFRVALIFRFRLGKQLFVAVPHWFIALAFAALAFALKPKPRLRFSLADILVLMTLSAMLIAGVAELTRLAS